MKIKLAYWMSEGWNKTAEWETDFIDVEPFFALIDTAVELRRLQKKAQEPTPGGPDRG